MRTHTAPKEKHRSRGQTAAAHFNIPKKVRRDSVIAFYGAEQAPSLPSTTRERQRHEIFRHIFELRLNARRPGCRAH